MQASGEQAAIVASIVVNHHNVVVDAVAGSGKTTTIVFLAEALDQEARKTESLRPASLLVLTYNKALVAETRVRMQSRSFEKVDVHVHTFHSLGLAAYVSPCHDDLALQRVVRDNLPFRWGFRSKRMAALAKPPAFDVVVVDEAQDTRPLYFDLVRKLMADMCPQARLLVIGNERQCVYRFRQADARFLRLADRLYTASPHAWRRLGLRLSYRITPSIAWFVNRRMLGFDYMEAAVTSARPKVTYITGDPFRRVPQYLVREVFLRLLTSNPLAGVVHVAPRPQDFFVLAPSIRSRNMHHPVNILERMLVQAGVPCFASTSDDEALDETVTGGKVVFSSYHQSKGLERRFVVVLAFSSAFYQSMESEPRDECPNCLYVAATRASEALFLWAESPRGRRPTYALPFLQPNADPREEDANMTFVHLDGLGLGFFGSEKADTAFATKQNPHHQNLTVSKMLPRARDTRRLSVTDLTRFLPDEALQQMVDLCAMREVAPAQGSGVHIPDFTDSKMSGGLREVVADLNGLAIPAMLEARLGSNKSFLPRMAHQEAAGKGPVLTIQADLRAFTHVFEESSDFLHAVRWATNVFPRSPADFLRLATIYWAYRTNFLHKFAQIGSYDWLTQDMADALLANLERAILPDPDKLDKLDKPDKPDKPDTPDKPDLCLSKEQEFVFEQELDLRHEMCLPGRRSAHVMWILGRADLVTNDCLWELKCVSELKPEHAVQLALYAWMWTRHAEASTSSSSSSFSFVDTGKKKNFRLLNFRTGQAMELTGTANLDCIAKLALEHHFIKSEEVSDDEFVSIHTLKHVIAKKESYAVHLRGTI